MSFYISFDFFELFF